MILMWQKASQPDRSPDPQDCPLQRLAQFQADGELVSDFSDVSIALMDVRKRVFVDELIAALNLEHERGNSPNPCRHARSSAIRLHRHPVKPDCRPGSPSSRLHRCRCSRPWPRGSSNPVTPARSSAPQSATKPSSPKKPSTSPSSAAALCPMCPKVMSCASWPPPR